MSKTGRLSAVTSQFFNTSVYFCRKSRPTGITESQYYASDTTSSQQHRDEKFLNVPSEMAYLAVRSLIKDRMWAAVLLFKTMNKWDHVPDGVRHSSSGVWSDKTQGEPEGKREMGN